MDMASQPIFIGDTFQKKSRNGSRGEYVHLLDEEFYKISSFNSIPPFFMTLVSSSNHWMFIASTGGLSAGRINADHALFPYYTVDKITENHENTGAKSIFLVQREGKRFLWEPFSNRQDGIYEVERNLYKNIPGNVLVFEEINQDLGLTFRYVWRTGDRFGFVKSSWLMNHAYTACQVELLDGLQNLLPANVTAQTQNTFSPLLDAYKRSELDPNTGLGIFGLNSTLTDLAEPSESLLCSVVWQVGLQADGFLLSSEQLEDFRAGLGVHSDTEIRGKRGAYFVHADIDLPVGSHQSWHIVADVDQDAVSVADLKQMLQIKSADLAALLFQDLDANADNLKKIVAAADGLQVTDDALITSHQFTNVMFNEMRGGYFPDQYHFSRSDFLNYVSSLNRYVLASQSTFITELPEAFSIDDLRARVSENGLPDLVRLANSYLPLSFSRRHGDPSRPWNRFSINIKKKDGSQQLDYEGNWRDIFQNWEALAYSYPEYTESMIFAFLNATTVDGYNPYRITRQGMDWEIPDPDNPWANIGYWSDHQIIYLLKLMEISNRTHPGRFQEILGQPLFSYANVPYRIKTYSEILQDPFNTINFDWELETRIKQRVSELGNDGKLVQTADGQILTSTLTEKILTLLLAKLVNFVPEGGVWMNTQRPEWNDANNALVGKGLSVVTVAYLRRYITFVRELISQSVSESFPVHLEVGDFYQQMLKILIDHLPGMRGGFDDSQRREMMDTLGQAGSDFRWNYYKNGFSGKTRSLNRSDLVAFLDLVQRYVDHTLRTNRRDDDLYHSYNILHIQPGIAKVSHLYEMLEGQVAILSSGLLNGAESLALLTSLRAGPLYRADQHSYILYPDRVLKGFIEKNIISPEQVKELELVRELKKVGDESLLVADSQGDFHFAGQLHNLKNVKQALEDLKSKSQFSRLVEREASHIESLFEQTFCHDQFTGRSGTFFAYEGLGSIYWHMVSKLLLAVQETIQRTREEISTAELINRYRDIRAGQCFTKTPAVYGAFPTDPYSHTPAGQGAKQPGMSGMVKEEILARQAELGFTIMNGRITFDFLFFNSGELLKNPSVYSYIDISNTPGQIDLPAGSLAYSICQVPVVLQASHQAGIQVFLTDGSPQIIEGHILDIDLSRHIFERDGEVHHLVVSVPDR